MPVAKKEIENSLTILKIGNVEIELGKKYVLDHKFDGSAPDGLKSIEATRLPFENNTVTDCVGFDDLYTKLYDTGFDKTSPCLSQYSKSELEELIPLYVKHIKVPYENANIVDLSSGKNNEFYKEYRYDLYVNQEFDTENVHQLFDLFNGLLQGYVCLKEERNPYYRDQAQFTISNPSAFKNKEKIKVEKRIEAFEKFSIMCQDREKLNLILEYVGKDNPEKIESKDLKTIYYKVINDEKGLDFAERFTEASGKYEDESGKLEMEYFAAVNRLQKANKIKRDKRGFFTVSGDFFLGNTMQDIAKHCMNTDSEQNKVITELMDEIR